MPKAATHVFEGRFLVVDDRQPPEEIRRPTDRCNRGGDLSGVEAPDRLISTIHSLWKAPDGLGKSSTEHFAEA